MNDLRRQRGRIQGRSSGIDAAQSGLRDDKERILHRHILNFQIQAFGATIHGRGSLLIGTNEHSLRVAIDARLSAQQDLIASTR